MVSMTNFLYSTCKANGTQLAKERRHQGRAMKEYSKAESENKTALRSAAIDGIKKQVATT